MTWLGMPYFPQCPHLIRTAHLTTATAATDPGSAATTQRVTNCTHSSVIIIRIAGL
jgi:hypothetical protein